MENKISLRANSKLIRENLNIPKISADIVTQIISSNFYKSANTVMLFYPLMYEINLLKLLSLNPEKKFFLPRMTSKTLECCEYKPEDKLVCSRYQILEPITPACNKNNIDIIFVPALAVNKDFHRLGYGSGYYDRFLKNYNGIKAAVIADELIINTLFAEDFDIKMDIIISQSKISVDNSQQKKTSLQRL